MEEMGKIKCNIWWNFFFHCSSHKSMPLRFFVAGSLIDWCFHQYALNSSLGLYWNHFLWTFLSQQLNVVWILMQSFPERCRFLWWVTLAWRFISLAESLLELHKCLRFYKSISSLFPLFFPMSHICTLWKVFSLLQLLLLFPS